MLKIIIIITRYILYINSLVCLWRCASTGGLGTGEVQVHPQQWIDGAPVGAESVWPSVIRWKSVFRHPVDGWCADGCWITLAQCDQMETGVLQQSKKTPFWDFMDGMKLPPGSVYLVSSFFFSLEPFSYHAFFFPCSHFFPRPFFLSLFSFSWNNTPVHYAQGSHYVWIISLLISQYYNRWWKKL